MKNKSDISPKSSNRFRKRQISFRVNEYEYDLIMKNYQESKAATLSSYLLDMATKGVVLNVDYSELKNVAYELNKIGTNINQIAHRVNENGEATWRDIKEVQAAFNNVRRIIAFAFRRFS